MKLNEDYFKDIDEEEIEAATSDSFYEDETDSAIKLLNIYDCNYSDTIVLYYPDSPYHFTDLDDVIYRINKIADRIYKLFDLYNIEHSEFVLYDQSVYYDMCVNGSEDSVNVYNIKDYKLFSSYTVTTPNGQIDNNYHFSEMFITIYVNYPKLTIKQVYHFAHRLMNIVWGNLRNRSIQNIYLMKPIIIPNGDFEDCMNRVTLTKTNMNFKIDNTINTKAVLTYLKPLMEYFFGYEYLKVDPITNEPYYTKLYQTQQITHR